MKTSRRNAVAESRLTLRTIGALLLVSSVLLTLVGMFDALLISLNHPRPYLATGESLTFIGFLLLPAIGVIVWYRPLSGKAARFKVLSLFVLFLDLIALGYWTGVLVVGLLGPVAQEYMPIGLDLTVVAFGALFAAAIFRMTRRRGSSA